MAEATTKSPWQSKTLVVNGILGVVACVSLFYPAAEGLKTFLSNHASEVAMVWSVLNIVLRAVTKEKIVLGD